VFDLKKLEEMRCVAVGFEDILSITAESIIGIGEHEKSAYLQTLDLGSGQVKNGQSFERQDV
jgi:hypothetical protein